MRASIASLFIVALIAGCATTPESATAGAEPPAADLAGSYEFSVDAEGQVVHGVMVINRADDGSYGGRISTDAAGTLVMTSVEVDGNRFTARGYDFSFTGQLDGHVVTGNWSYMGMQGTLRAHRR